MIARDLPDLTRTVLLAVPQSRHSCSWARSSELARGTGMLDAIVPPWNLFFFRGFFSTSQLQ
jgi:hypothetical protein